MKTHVLVVEDEAIVAADLAGKLTLLGYEVVGTAARGEEAIALAREHRPDIVVMDIQLAGPMDGIAAAEVIRTELDLPVIFLTAHSDPATLERARLSEPFGYVLKPFEERELHTNLEMALYRHRLDRHLRESRERLALALASARMATFDWDIVTNKRLWSEGVHNLFGTRSDTFTGTQDEFFRIIHPEDRDTVRKALAQALETSGVYEAEYRAVWPDGRIVHIAARGKVLRDRAGQPLLLTGICWDVTERKLTDEVLRFLGQCGTRASGEDFFKELARYLARALDMDFVCIDRLEENLLAAQTLAVFHNGTFEDNLSYTLKDTPCGDAVGRRICCYPRNVRGLFAKDAVLQGLQAESYLGTTLWDSQGRPIGLIAVIGRQPLQDTRQAESLLQLVAVRAAAELERQLTEAALRASEERYRLLFQNLQEGFYLAEAIFDVGGTCCDAQYIEVNPEFERIMGKPRDQIVGKLVTDLVPRIKPEWLAVFGKVVRTGEAVTHQAYSETFQKHFEAFVFRPSPGQFGVLVTDVTERLRAEEALRQLNAELERRVAERTAELAATNRELEAFCYSVSHDLRAPLRSMDGFSQALLEDCGPQLDANGQDFLRRIRSNCQRMAQLIDDLLQLSRLTRSQMRHQPVDLTALAQSVIKDLRQADPARSVDVRIAPGLTATGDPVLLHTALVNLLQNAWKFTGQRPDAMIDVGTEVGGQRSAIVFFVRDNGTGFDMQYADKLFTPFQRLHAMTEFPGSGVGLATVQRVIHRHGGRVWFESAPGKGATFYFTIGEHA